MSAQRSTLAFLGMLVGAGCVLVAGIGVINVAAELKLALRVAGTRTELPGSYDEVLGLAGVGLLILGLSWFGDTVRQRLQVHRGKPLVRVAIVASAALVLVSVGAVIRRVALVSTYGSMLAYYATDGELSDVHAELAKNPSAQELDEAIFRAAQYENAPALDALLKAGANFRQESRPDHRRHCFLVGATEAFLRTAIEHGVRATDCPNGDEAIWRAVANAESDEASERLVRLFISAGWSPQAKPKHERASALELAKGKGWARTVAALEGA